MDNKIITGFSKLSRIEKLRCLGDISGKGAQIEADLDYFRLDDLEQQNLLDEISENTLSNFFLPFGIAPNFVINDKVYHLPMVTEESSVIAAASRSAKFWASRGGFKAKVVSVEKTGQVHFLWNGKSDRLKQAFPDLKKELLCATHGLTKNMRRRGGGISDLSLVDMSHEMENYYQLHVSFDTLDAMGANFINSCLEMMASTLESFIQSQKDWTDEERDCEIIMSILSNYTPDCLVECWVECDIKDLDDVFDGMSGEDFANKFKKATQIAELDVYRACTHNKGIMNGVDAVALATGNDFRAVEANAHVWASQTGKYKSLTKATISDGRFKYELKLPLALGTVGGLTKLHPLAKLGLELLGDPSAKELMMMTAASGLANNFGAIRSLVTTGIQHGHMKMHLSNLLNTFNANKAEKLKAQTRFAKSTVSYSEVENFLKAIRNTK
ncbi:hydroxymethylglutaryl-CoA reductase, degradative [Ancylomarina sp. 16SWW S1-10-2]|uniref:hydroxymethylglutaryl-CoA reductase, degradative n=1 Tax=Ancylomarina sp. 16SWW S1-10-2 TaxID=2499681 RepID=UPI0012ADF6EC|nr:hydroxymethylglutaryl-CoA reductase, degradative [Ancylomarina sp. 16SWW S1-10-2]MRT92457.1 hydroxymethylglutaryl-CoA reductase, degradative [Ancylomarina sp. 16SWW S1-10-2]